MRTPFGVTPDGTPVELFTLGNTEGMQLSVMSYGGAIVSLRVPDRDGNLDDIVLGFDSLDAYIRHSHYFGAIVGRYANRIGRGRLQLDGSRYQLPINDEPHHLHGGVRGFDRVAWQCEPFRDGRDGRRRNGLEEERPVEGRSHELEPEGDGRGGEAQVGAPGSETPGDGGSAWRRHLAV